MNIFLRSGLEEAYIIGLLEAPIWHRVTSLCGDEQKKSLQKEVEDY